MDETAIQLDSPTNYTYAPKGRKIFQIKLTRAFLPIKNYV